MKKSVLMGRTINFIRYTRRHKRHSYGDRYWPEPLPPITETYTYFYYGTDPNPIMRHYRIDHLVKEDVAGLSTLQVVSLGFDHVYEDRRPIKVLNREFAAHLVRDFGVLIKDEDDGTE